MMFKVISSLRRFWILPVGPAEPRVHAVAVEEVEARQRPHGSLALHWAEADLTLPRALAPPELDFSLREDVDRFFLTLRQIRNLHT